MTLSETLKQLKALGNAKVRAQNAKGGAGDNQFGVSLGDIRVLAKKIRTNHELALLLWKTGNVDAQFLATLLIQPKKLSAKEMDRVTRPLTFVPWRTGSIAYVVRQHPDKEALRRDWMAADDHVGGPRRSGPHRQEGSRSPGRPRPPRAAGSHRNGNGGGRSRRCSGR